MSQKITRSERGGWETGGSIIVFSKDMVLPGWSWVKDKGDSRTGSFHLFYLFIFCFPALVRNN